MDGVIRIFRAKELVSFMFSGAYDSRPVPFWVIEWCFRGKMPKRFLEPFPSGLMRLPLVKSDFFIFGRVGEFAETGDPSPRCLYTSLHLWYPLLSQKRKGSLTGA